jgi:hypothetical protein
LADPDKGLPTQISELWELIVTYAKQETVDPLKALLKFLAWGVGGAVCLGLGLVLLALAGLRAMQQELAPHLSGNWSWLPYVVVVAAAGAVAGVLARAIGADKRRADAARARLAAEKGRG